MPNWIDIQKAIASNPLKFSVFIMGRSLIKILISTAILVQAEEVITNAEDNLHATGDPYTTARIKHNADLIELYGSKNQAASNSVLLCHANGYSSGYSSDFIAAYDAAVDGETIYLASGSYNVGYLHFTKSVSIAGRGQGTWSGTNFNGGTVIKGHLYFGTSATNILICDLSLQNYEDVFTFEYGGGQNERNTTIHNVSVGCTSHTNFHNVELSGANLTVSNLASYSGGYHGIVFKGCSNVVANQLFSKGSGAGGNGDDLLLKASAGAGNNINIDISDVVLDSSGAGTIPLFIQTYDNNFSTKAINISNVTIFADPLIRFTFYIEALDMSRETKNIHLDSIKCLSTNCAYAFIVGAYNPVNIDFQNCEIDSPRVSTPVSFSQIPANPNGVTGRDFLLNDMYYDVTGYTVTQSANVRLAIDFYAGILVRGPIGTTNRIEFVSDIQSTNWTTLTNIVLHQSSEFIIDRNSTKSGRRYYRAARLE